MKSKLDRDFESAGWVRPQPTDEPPTINRRSLQQARDSAKRKEEAEERLGVERALRLSSLRLNIANQSEPAPPLKRTQWGLFGFCAALVVTVSLIVSAVLIFRSAQGAEALEMEKMSRAGLVCVGGNVSARNSSNFWTKLTGGADFRCSNWETQEARKDRKEAAQEARRVSREELKRREALESSVPSR